MGAPDARVAPFLGRVLDENGDPAGTCFQVSPGVLVTAWHVLDAVGVPAPGDAVVVDPLAGGPAFSVIVLVVDELQDLAVLRGDSQLAGSVPGLVPTDGVALRAELEIAGVSRVQDRHVYRFMTTTGTWQGPVTRDEQLPLGRVTADAILPGMSGAPVLRSGDQMVLGVLSGRYCSADGWLQHTGWVARTETLIGMLAGIADPLVQAPVTGRPAELVLSVGERSVSLSGDGWQVTAGHRGISPQLAAAVSEMAQARARTATTRRDSAPTAQDLGPATESGGEQLALGRVGQLMAQAFLPAQVGGRLGEVLGAARAAHMPVRLGVHATGSVGGLPWEALAGPHGAGPLALHPLVALYRRIPQAQSAAATPGPLRILVAIAAPESPRSGVLNYEHELRAVLAAVRTARQGHAQVRIVPFATTEAIRAELTAAAVHVLHLSGHGTPGLLQLEDAAGRPRAVTADQFADEAIPPGKMPAVIALSACYTDVAEADGAASFAQRLCERGASAVVATETSITDSYATRVFARVYERLTGDSAADVVAAVADARRAVHQELADLPGPDAAAASQEWAVLSVLARTGALSLIDPGASPQDAPWRNRPRIPELIDREAGEFVGRRRELRSWPAQLAGTSTSGIVIHGIGGIGKTTLASELANRYAETLGQAVIACHRGPAGVDTVLATITSALRRHLIGTGITASPLYGALAACAAAEIPWRERMEYLTGQILPGLPAMLLILDNFEDNLTGGPARIVADPDLAELLADLAGTPGTTRLLITSRYPFTLPGHGERTLTFHQVAPLSLAETLKLIWALPALDRLDPGQVEQVWRLLGGHPRALEYLDALLAQGHGRFPDITRRLTTAVQHRLGDTTAADAWFTARSQLDAALAETVTLAADDIILGDLLTELRATPGAIELLHGTAVYREPVDDIALLFQIGVPDPSPAPPDRQAAAEAISGILASAGIATDKPVELQALPEPVRRAITPYWEVYAAPPVPPYREPLGLERAVRACADSSLLTVLASERDQARRVFVHRWTADELARAPGLDPGQARRAHLAAARYWNWRVDSWPQPPAADIHDLLEARDHLLRAGEGDQAIELSEEIVTLLDERGAWDQATAVARETLATLTPDSDQRGPWLNMLGNLAEKHGDIQQAEQLHRQALGIDQRLAEAAPDNPGYQRNLSVTYGQLADLARDAGQPGQAEQLHRQALAIRERLAAAAPDNPGYQQDLSVTFERLADLAGDAGQPGQAEQLHRQALAIWERLAAAAPDNPGYQHGLSVTFERLADLAGDAGQPGQGEQLHRQALAIRERLAAAAPDNPGYQRGLSVTYGKLADLARDAGQPGQAEQLHRQALAIRERLAAAAPDNPGYQRDLSVTYGQLADLARDAGQPGQAEQLHRQALGMDQRLAAAAPDNPGYQHGLSVTYSQLADLARDAGQPGQAEQLHHQALAIRERLAAAAPDNPGYQRNLSFTYGKLADLARNAGQPGQAEQLHRQALAIDQRLAAAAPDNPDYQHGLSVTFERLADLARDAGQPGQAEQLYRQALAIWERLAAAAPDNPDYQHGLSVTFERLADLAGDAGQPGQGEQLYRQALAIWERLAAAAPDNPGYQRGLSVTYGKLADLARDAGQPGQAEQLHRQALAIRERLAAAAPDNPGYQRDLSVTYGQLADLAGDAGQPGQAEQLYRQALAIWEGLAAAAPDNPGYQRGLSVTFERLADLAGDAGQPGQAEQLYRQALAIWEGLAAAAPDNPDYQHGLSVTFERLADLAGDAGQPGQAEQLYRQALAIRERLAAAAPDNPGYQRGLSVTYGKLADLARDAGQPGQAEQLHRQALAIRERLAAAAPDNPGYQRDLSVTYGQLADLARDAGQPGQAEQLYRQALAIDQRLAAAAPDNPGYQRDLSVTYSQLADLARDAGQPGQAEQLYRQALAIRERLAAAAPDNPGYQRNLSFTYGKLADLARNAGQPGQAEQLHRQALVLFRQVGDRLGEASTLLALGDLQVRTNRLTEADRSYSQALDLYQQLEDRLGEANTLQSLGRFFAVSGEDDKAEAAFAAALDGFESIGDRYSAAATLAYRGQHRVANHRADGFRDWRRALDLAIIEDSGLFGQVVMITVGDARRMFQSGEADDFLTGALPGLLQTGPEHDASALSDEQNAAHAMAIAGFGLIRDLAAIRASGPPPESADRSSLLETARRFDEATGAVFGLAAAAQDILMQADVRALDQPLASLTAEWVQTPTWKESQTFLNDHHRELLSADGQAALAALAEASPSNDTLALHVNLLNAARRDGVAAAYSQLLTELQAEEAAAAVRGWLSLAPDWAASAAYHAEHADQLSDPAAIAALTQACWAEPGDLQLWLHLGLLLMGDQRADGYASAANGEPDPFRAADALLAAGDLDRALAWSSLARARDSGPGALLMARIQLIRNEPDQAAEALTAATTQMSKDQFSEVLAAYDTLLQAQPGEPWRHAEHAAALQSAGRPADALAAYDRAIALAPDNASFHFNKGNLLFDLGRFDEARPELLEVTRLRPDDVLGTQVLLGAIAWPADPEEAREHFTAATSSPGALLTPFTRALYHAIALAGLGHAEEAAAQLEAARSARSADDVPDDTTKRLLEQLQTPPIPGLDDLRPFLQPADPGNAPEEQGHPPADNPQL